MDGSDQIKRGLLWLGSASALARIVDLGATFIVLGVLSQQEMGLGAIAISTTAVVESLSGLGIGGAIVQSKQLSDREQASLFWLTSGLGVALGGLLCAISPVMARIYEQPLLVFLLAVSGVKLLLVGMSLVPLQVLNKRLAFREVGAVQTVASLGEAISKIALALAGTGAWALVGGNVMRGVTLLLALGLASRFRPTWHFELAETRRFVRFGLQIAGSSGLQQLCKNADYFLVGKLLGIEALGLYRVAFDIAMQPIEAIIAVVNRVGFPVYARLSDNARAFVEAFSRSTRSFLLLAIPIAAFIALAAGDLLSLLGDGRWVEAAAGLRILALAGIARAAAMMFPVMYVALGRPAIAMFDSVLSLLALTGGFLIALTQFPQFGIVSVCVTWFLVYPVLLSLHVLLTSHLTPLRPWLYLRALMPGVGGGLCMLVGVVIARRVLPASGAGLFGLLAMACSGLLAYGIYLRCVLKLRWSELAPRASSG